MGDLCSGASLQNFNSKTITFSQNSRSFYLKRLTITLEDTCTQTRFEILETPDQLCGNHIPGGNEEPSPVGAFLVALMGTGALLISAFAPEGTIVAAAGFMLDVGLVACDWAEVAELATRQYRNRQVDVYDYEDQQTNWAEAYASTWTCVDASLSIFVDWILDDTNNKHHSLTITAKAEYWDLTSPDYPVNKPPITTTLNLEIKLDDNNSFDKADPIEEGIHPWLYIDITHDSVDYYKIRVPQGRKICVMMKIGSSYPDQDFNLYLYDPYRVLRDKSELGPGKTEYVEIVADTAGYWYIKVTTTPGDWGFYNLTVAINGITGGHGGLDVPIDKVSLITPYIASTLMVCVGFIVSSRKFWKRKRS
ncbi:MAG: hypothetical protein ACUVRA_01900 [Candidatus Bathyarchaeaceae archaeon]